MNPEKMGGFPKESVPGETHTADYKEHVLDIYKVIALADAQNLETEQVALETLADFKNNNHWYDTNKNWIITNELIDAYEAAKDWNVVIVQHPEWEKEIERIKKADYETHPIIMIGDEVVDGIHRLIHAWTDGVTTIPIKRFEHLSEEELQSLEIGEELKKK